jgi:hypothetical protein
MTLAAEQPRRARWGRGPRARTATATTATGTRTMARLQGATLVGFLAVIAAAWGGSVIYWGPAIGYYPTSLTTWDWTTQNWLLHLVPGAVGVAAGLMIMMLSPARRMGAGATMSLPALLLMAAGAWFVIGPAAWRTFESGTPYLVGESALRSFANEVGSALGPGVLLAIFGGMALKAAMMRPAVVEAPVATATPAMAEAPAAAAAPAPAAERPMTTGGSTVSGAPVAADRPEMTGATTPAAAEAPAAAPRRRWLRGRQTNGPAVSEVPTERTTATPVAEGGTRAAPPEAG